MQIRIAHASDADTIARLHTDSWQIVYRGILPAHYLDHALLSERQQAWKQRFAVPERHQCVFLAEQAGAAVGFACAFGAYDPEHGTQLENLHVHTASKGKGIGAALMQTSARWSAQNHPGLGLYLWAVTANTAARHFYEHLGGTISGSGFWDSPAGVPVPEVRFSWANAKDLVKDSDPITCYRIACVDPSAP